MCSHSTPDWSATEAMQSFSHCELRKLGVTMENFTVTIVSNCAQGWQPKSCEDKLFDCQAECFISIRQGPVSGQTQPMNQNPPNAPATP